MRSRPQYVLGSDEAEIVRLESQAAAIAPATGLLLRAAGIAPGMRVLDLGTGLGHVSLHLAELVGPGGSVLGIDQDDAMLEAAEQRALVAGAENVQFLKADVRAYQPSKPLDAVVGRLILFHLPDAVEILRRYVDALKPGGLMLAVDFDIGSARAEPALPLFTTVADWVMQAFRDAGANPTIGARLAMLLRDAGLEDVTSFGVQDYLGPDDPRGPALLAGVVRSLRGQIVAAGIASEAELDLDTLQQRLAQELATADAVMLPPAVAGAWGRRG
jgi:cyclopropane fatty-acyl-phospholipid synthase-like methyltransferase